MSELYVIGTGPGDPAYLLPAARDALERVEAVVGYGLYLDLLGPLAEGKRRHALPLGQESERARLALRLAEGGTPTALVCSGDPGIYALASLVLELMDREGRGQGVAVEIVPGISAAQLAAARLGAPLGHDFCFVSLSDLLTPWPVIERRLHAAAMGDFVVCLYNPVSRRRRRQLPRAREILLGHRRGDTPVALARAVGRPDEAIRLTTLEALDAAAVDMLTVVIVGNSQSRRLGERLYTPRGYF